MRESLKALAADLEYKSLRSMCDSLFEEFLQKKPYKSRAFLWSQPEKPGAPGWIAFNVVVTDDIQARVKAEAVNIEVSLSTLLYSALLWWIESNTPLTKPPGEQEE